MTPTLRFRVIYERNYVIESMEMSFFVSCPISNAQADPDKSGHRPPYCIIVKSSLRVCPDLRGTLRPHVKRHAAKKDIFMLLSAVSFLGATRRPPWCDVIVTTCCQCNISKAGPIELSHQKPGLPAIRQAGLGRRHK